MLCEEVIQDAILRNRTVSLGNFCHERPPRRRVLEMSVMQPGPRGSLLHLSQGSRVVAHHEGFQRQSAGQKLTAPAGERAGKLQVTGGLELFFLQFFLWVSRFSEFFQHSTHPSTVDLTDPSTWNPQSGVRSLTKAAISQNPPASFSRYTTTRDCEFFLGKMIKQLWLVTEQHFFALPTISLVCSKRTHIKPRRFFRAPPACPWHNVYPIVFLRDVKEQNVLVLTALLQARDSTREPSYSPVKATSINRQVCTPVFFRRRDIFRRISPRPEGLV